MANNVTSNKSGPAISEFCWNELMTPNTKMAKEFYESLLGWKSIDHDMGDKTYTVFTSGHKEVCGMLQTPKDKTHVPPHWMSYICVESIDHMLKKAQSLEAKIMAPKTMAGDKGYFAIIQDPTGAHIAFWQPVS